MSEEDTTLVPVAATAEAAAASDTTAAAAAAAGAVVSKKRKVEDISTTETAAASDEQNRPDETATVATEDATSSSTGEVPTTTVSDPVDEKKAPTETKEDSSDIAKTTSAVDTDDKGGDGDGIVPSMRTVAMDIEDDAASKPGKDTAAEPGANENETNAAEVAAQATMTTTTEQGNAEQIAAEPPTPLTGVPEASKGEKNGTTEPQPTPDTKAGDLKSPEKQNPYEKLRYTTVRNDGQPASMIKLIGLKSLFAKQLPKMPRAYIARLVLDRRHTSLAILSDNPALKDSDEEIIGGICYRAFREQRFAEIAFCAINATHQVKGYGTKLMNLLKQTAAQEGIEFFITYADNYAIGYFKKQGFSKTISMPKGRYTGLIKDYDGGTPMECYVHPSVDYTRIPEMIRAQRAFILERMALTAHSLTTVYPPYDVSQRKKQQESQDLSRAARALMVPGVLEAGWTLQDMVHSTPMDTDRQKSALKQDLVATLRKIEEQQFAWPFREPVDPQEVPDYPTVISNPIDLKTIMQRIKQDYYKSKLMLFNDLMLMVNNCKLYNEDGSTYIECAESLEKYARSQFHDTLVATGSKNKT